MSRLRYENVIGLLCSDIHLKHSKPPSRSKEPDWYKAMARPLDELKLLTDHFKVPVIAAGDIFDYWQSPPELINFAMDHLPPMYAIPGQHDLPLHNFEDIHKSAYFTLVKHGLITNIVYDTPIVLDEIVIHGFPWKFPVQPPKHPSKQVQLAVVHEYIWKKGCSFPGASVEHKVSKFAKKLNGFDAAVFGDNHLGFTASLGECEIINTGSLIRQKIDQRDYKPRIGILMRNGMIEEYFLDTSQDLFRSIDDKTAFIAEQYGLDISAFIKELEELGDIGLNYEQALKYYKKSNKISRAGLKLLDELMEDM